MLRQPAWYPAHKTKNPIWTVFISHMENMGGKLLDQVQLEETTFQWGICVFWIFPLEGTEGTGAHIGILSYIPTAILVGHV